MTNILLPTDFSDNSKNAIRYTLHLYANEKCTFYILNSAKVIATRSASFSSKLGTTVLENSKRDLAALKDALQAEFTNKNHTFKIIASANDLDDAIEIFAEKYEIDLIVMGTKGATGAKEILFGSNTTKIFKKVTSCPILAIPENHTFVVPTQIGFPSDFNRYCDAKELHFLKKMAKLHDASIRIIHIHETERLSEQQEQNMTTLKQYLKEHKHSFHWIQNYTSKEKAIHEFIDEMQIEMLAMVQYSHGFIDRMLREPVIKKIGFHLKVPFLVIPE
ncbi:universal stress protein [Kordia algicida OT-1]|uniref:Universal stress protein n=1 Tax=Kordia algicida OT-1 TaxID=391587 RepID=A9EAF2_9FLAO|nr:universal stress protein [Kordia algicida]EDP94623.1 universal stress protein [Kordia algicida OT-1]